MELIISPTSPFARKVQILAHELDLAQAMTLHKLNPLENAAELAVINPLGRVPALITDEGQLVVDSSVICTWLDNLAIHQGKAGLLGDSREAQLRIQQGQALADGIMEIAFLMVMERARPEGECSDFWQDRRRGAIVRTLDYLEQNLAALIPQGINLASIALACALGYLDFRHGEMEWRSARPGLARWFQQWETRESFRLTRPPG